MDSPFEDSKDYHYLYNNARWRKTRMRLLTSHPLCVFCLAKDKYVPATVADHIIPHKGDVSLFWDYNNLQSLCAPCHNGTKQAMEKGKSTGNDINGLPNDPTHHWYK